MPTGKIQEANYFKIIQTIITKDTLHLLTFFFSLSGKFEICSPKENKSPSQESICSKTLVYLNPTFCEEYHSSSHQCVFYGELGGKNTILFVQFSFLHLNRSNVKITISRNSGCFWVKQEETSTSLVFGGFLFVCLFLIS